MVRYLFYTIGDLTYQSPLVFTVKVQVFRVTVRDISSDLIAFISLDCMTLQVKTTASFGTSRNISPKSKLDTTKDLNLHQFQSSATLTEGPENPYLL